LIAGSGPLARHAQRLVEVHPEWGYEVAGFVERVPKGGGTVGEGRSNIETMSARMRVWECSWICR
jgi:hypothetical protein